MKKLTALLLTTILVLTLFTACGANSIAQSAPAMKGDYTVEEMAPEAPAAMMNAMSGAGETGSTPLPENRKWIVTVHMDAETDDLDTLMTGLDETINGLEGYVEDQEIYNGSNYASYRRRNANLTIRIPAEDVSHFTEAVSGIANVVSTNVSREDITLTYVATESKVNALKTEETRLLELMAKAENMSELLQIEERLTDVRTELEQVTSQLRVYDNLVDYGTIHLNLRQVTEFTDTTQEPTVWQRIGSGFISSVKGLWNFIVELFVFTIVASPYLVIVGIIVFVVIRIIKKRKTP